MKLLKIMVFCSLLAFPLTVPCQEVSGDETTVVDLETGQEVSDLEADLVQLLDKINNLAESGQEIPQDVKALVGQVTAKIERAERPIDKDTVLDWVALIDELVLLLGTAIVGIIGITEFLKITKDGTADAFRTKFDSIRTRYLVVVATAVVTVLSVTLFKPEAGGGWSLIEAGTFFLTTLFGAIRVNRELINLGLKDD